MQSAPIATLPPLSDTRYSRESLLHALSHESRLPSTAVAVATLYVQDIATDILAMIERAGREELDLPAGRLLFRGLHILGGRQITAAYRPLVAFLCGPQDRVDDLLGDVVTETLSKILAGVYDGDQEPLRALVTDLEVNPFVCEAALQALAFLCFEGRIDREGFEAFLLRLDEEKLLPLDDDIMWHAWMSAIGVLGIERLVPRVRAAFADGRIAPGWCDEDDFDELLKAAIERPDVRTRLAREQMGYIEDVLQELERWPTEEDTAAKDDPITDDELLDWAASGYLARSVPAHNPFRGVGRNDPCPCGSGKKAKKCCLH